MGALHSRNWRSYRSALEVGCGAGHGLAPIRAELRADATLTASDFSSEMLARAWLSSQLSTAKLMAELAPAQCSAIEACVARRADAIMAAGAPIACDVVVVTARKP